MIMTIRQAYGEALVKYGKKNKDIVVFDADVSGSTRSCAFQEACPERFFNVGIAEANMTAMAGGMAASGKIPFVNSFAVFLSSAGLLAARTLGSYARLPVKFAGAYGGLSDAFDGPSHHSLEDIAIMRSLPNFKVFVASDPVQTEWLVKNAIEDRSPMYLRLSRDVFPNIYNEHDIFEEGKGKMIRCGKDIAIISCGLMVGNAMAAADILSKKGIEASVIDMFCIKPLDKELVVKCAKEMGAIVTAEEHNIIGGLGSAVSEVLCEAGTQVPVGFVGMQDVHAECGPYSDLQKKYKLDAQAIAEKACEIISRK